MKNKLGLATSVPAALLIFVLVLTLILACNGTLASAESASVGAEELSGLTFGQMSDIHYFPEEFCYPSSEEDYLDSDFYHSTTGDTKLVIESGALLKEHVKELIEDAKAGIAPHYLFTTGDLSKNGERVALVDVANELRYLQNEMRKIKGYETFQVFAITGNHDLYNGSGKLYYHTDGSEYQAEVITSAQFALIFTGLGYPDVSYDDLLTVYPEEYWSSSYTGGYVESETADGLTVTYFNEGLQVAYDSETFSESNYASLFDGGAINGLSYFVTSEKDPDYAFFVLDGTDRELTEDIVPVRVSRSEYDRIKSGGYDFYLGGEENAISTETATSSDINTAFANGDPVYTDIGYDHLTGGRLTEPLLDWMRDLTAGDDRTYVAAYHFNVLPHFEQEDDILKDFVFYNWEYIAKEFLQMGVRYGVSGHMHSSDVAYYTDAAGRTFYDIETGSSVSYASPRRYMTVTKYSLADGKVGEKFESSLHVLESFEGMTNAEDYNDYINQAIYGQLVERIVDHFITIRTIDDLGLAELADGLISIPNMNLPIGKIVQYLLDEITDNLYPAPDGYPGFEGQTQPTDLMDYIKKGAAQELIGMKFGAEGNELTLAQIFSFIMMAHAAGVEPTTAEVFEGELPAITGTASEILDPLDPVWRARYIAALRDFAEKCDSGQLAKDLFGILLDTLYYDEDSILKTLFAHRFNFGEGGVGINYIILNMVESIINNPANLANTIFEMIEVDDATRAEVLAAIPEGTKLNIDLTDFSLGELIDGLWPIVKTIVSNLLGIDLAGNSIFDAVDGLLNSYLTDSFYVGLSGIAKNIVIAYATDDEIDLADASDPTAPLVLKPYEGYAEGYATELTYVSDTPVPIEHNLPTADNGRLPSHITGNFLPSDEQGASYGLSFYTGEEIGVSVILKDADGNVIDSVKVTEEDLDNSKDKEYRTVEIKGEDGKITLTGGTYAQYIPLIDLGLLTISHTETEYEDEDGNVYPYTYLDRDNAPANSVVYRNRWKVTFDDLNFGTKYTYELRGAYAGKEFDLRHYAGLDELSFTTAPSDTETDFDFVAIADMQGMIQSMYESSASAIDYIMQNAGGYDLILNAGDMADNGDNFNQWGWAFNENLEFFANSSTFATAGNHEDEGGKLSDFYNYDALLPAQDTDSGAYYSFDYASAHIIVINTNDADAQNGLSEAQYEWLISDLEKNKDAKWTFVLMHKSLYSGGSHSFDGDVVAMRKQLVPVFYSYGVDIVFAGHDHTYTVTETLDGNGNAVNRASYSDGSFTLTADGDGVMYVTLGTIGTKFYDYVSNPEIEDKFHTEGSILRTLTDQTFAKISVKGDTLTYTGYVAGEDGSASVIDNEPTDDLLLVKILVPIAAVVLIAGVVVAVILVRKKKQAAHTDGN